MLLQVVLSIESPSTRIAVVQSFTSVKLEVNVEVSFVQELLAANCAYESVFRQMLRSMEGHCIVGFEFLLADRTRKFLLGIVVLVQVGGETIFLEARKSAVGNCALERFTTAVLLWHVTELCWSICEY